MKSTIFLLFVGVWIAPIVLIAGDRISGQNFVTRSEVISPNGMVCTSQPLATQVGLRVLQQGGNAVDAAIAANAVLGLVEPTGCGIGGDLFAIIWDAKTEQLYGLNASGRSPQSLSLEMIREMGYAYMPSEGPMPVTVPGCVDGWFCLHDRFGKMPIKKLLQPAIGYAREGFPVSEVIAEAWQDNVDRLRDYPGFAAVFTLDGRAPRKGEIFRNPALASTLQKLAKKGRDCFYKGEIAHEIDAFMQEYGGYLRYADLAAHKSDWLQPVSTNYRGYDIWELPPNGQGIAALQMLNILEGYDLSALGFGSSEYMHLFIETKKLCFEDRAKYYADPDFNDIPVDALISKEYAAERRKLIDPQRALYRIPAGNPALKRGDTVYLTVADQEGNMVSLIQSNYWGIGSGMTPVKLGFCFQDRGNLFSLREGEFNCYASRKRPFHTIIPAFISKDGKPYISFGVMGGSMQPQGHVQIVVNLIDFGMNLQEAGDAPRIRHSGSSQPTGETMVDGGRVYLESGFSYETIRELEKMGHRIEYRVGGFGGYQAIRWDPAEDVYYGASESRKDGMAAGY